MFSNLKDNIISLYNVIKNLFNIFLNFFPSPIDGIVKTFCTILFILLIIKLVKLIGSLVENIIGAFI